MIRLDAKFFTRSPLIVAKDLVGKLLVHEVSSGQRLIMRIVETEAYREDDPACHAYANWLKQKDGKAVTGRSALLFGPPAVAYVYLNYGVHWLFNVVTDKPGKAGAVLIRGGEPVEGVELMRTLRPSARNDEALGRGPGNFAKAMAIDPKFNGQVLTQGALYFADDRARFTSKNAIRTSSRIGISKGQDLHWRFFAAEHPSVSG